LSYDTHSKRSTKQQVFKELSEKIEEWKEETRSFLSKQRKLRQISKEDAESFKLHNPHIKIDTQSIKTVSMQDIEDQKQEEMAPP
jgi:hypothetical protein